MECTVRSEEMIEVLYGEADAATVRRVEEHQAVCASCREEMAGLRSLRRELAAWTLPAAPRTRLGAGRFVPPRALAAAATLLLALGAGLGLSGSELRLGDGHFSFRLGRADADVSRLLAAQEVRHRDEIRALQASLPARDDVLNAVRAMVRESEARQAVLLGAGLADLGAKADAQRRYDLARVSAGLSYLDGKSGQQMARTAELVGYVLQNAQPGSAQR